MKKLKTVTTAIIFTVLSVITGCSDDFISPTANNSTGVISAPVDRTLDNKIFHGKFILKAHQKITLNSSNTIFSSFKSISIMNCGSIKKNSLEILGYLNDVVMVLGCNSKGFDAYSITIENKSQNVIELDVFLTGINNSAQEPPLKWEDRIE